jgi:hypothetical protein
MLFWGTQQRQHHPQGAGHHAQLSHSCQLHPGLCDSAALAAAVYICICFVCACVRACVRAQPTLTAGLPTPPPPCADERDASSYLKLIQDLGPPCQADAAPVCVDMRVRVLGFDARENAADVTMWVWDGTDARPVSAR